ncbi:amino acid/amide ABC transporter substrate-binding protein, HAAT family [Methylorubrum salsuginis]|uniref:Amino acid/amide ABC transporter substrate-binding protein, HAAT family n=1 Tax=Methylorubrum salsuginis TaxID=414703 RepID=A0A1I4A078_9HYPH|nr:branched-chain amino acid ABC transporter substrate-binding protein [Methylorubrum salsuginis]SFK49784.1 amino acid/amide ABC transporter substrate-binding protein, HAAT family [Methylorubrum salsuginis]
MRGRIARSALALLALGGVAQAAEPLRIGLALPLSGADAGFGQGARLGAEQAVAEINRAGGVLGQKIQLVVQDDAGDPKQAVAAARKLASGGVRFVVGHLHSGAAAAASPVYEEAGIVAVTPGATWAPLTRRGAGLLFRLAGSDAQQGAIGGTLLAQRFRDRPVAIVHDKTSFGRALADEAARALKAGGGRERLFEGVSRDDREVAGLVAKLRALGIEAVYFGGLQAPAALLVKAMREAGLTTQLIGSDGLLDKEFPVTAGAAAEGTLMTLAPSPPRLPDVRGAARAPRTPEAEMFAAPAYAAFEAIRQGAEGARSTDPARVAAHLHGGAPLRTLLGEIAFDARGDLARPPFAVATWRKLADGRIDYAGTETPP